MEMSDDERIEELEARVHLLEEHLLELADAQSPGDGGENPESFRQRYERRFESD